jgi:redox-sensitive bicupin YhaK (pirin superfamily)
MSNTGLIIEERSRDIGDFLVGRLLPFRKKRMVGPFIFIDHMGPSTIRPGHYMDVGQHPHIGLSTLTYLFEGEIDHRDSLGTFQRVTAGSVGWMTAGKGIVHTERTPPEYRDGNHYQVHGFQIWVALPKDREEMDPEFSYTEAKALPSWSEAGLNFTLIAGKGYGRQSPVPVYSDLFMVEVKANSATFFDIADQLYGEVGICVVDGAIEACGERIEKGQMLVSKQEDTCKINLEASTHLLLFGGQPLPEKRHIYWNFVASERETIQAASDRWEAKTFEMVPGETGYIPLPPMRFSKQK